MSTAWIYEESDDEDHTRSLGLFAVSLQGEGVPGGYEEGPYPVPIDEALAWARERTDVIIVRYQAPDGEPHQFSAGARDPEWSDDTPPRWPPEALDLSPRRSGEFWYLDRTDADEPISWDVVVVVTQGWGDPVPAFAGRFAGALRASDKLEIVGWEAGPGGGLSEKDVEGGFTGYVPFGNEAVRVKVQASASTSDAVEALVVSEGQRVKAGVLDVLGVEERGGDFGWAVKAMAYPTGSSMAGMNPGIRAPSDRNVVAAGAARVHDGRVHPQRDRILTIGFDAAAASIVFPLAERGDLPVLGRLIREGARTELRSLSYDIPENNWPTWATGCGPAAHGIYDWRQREPDGYGLVQNPPRTRRRPFWRLLRDPAVSGDDLPRTLLLDIPYPGFEPDDDGCVHVFGWGQRGAQMHASSPAPLLAEIEARHGTYPQIFNREAANRPLVSRSQLRALERVTAKRADVLIDLMNAHPWDLCGAVFFEPHLAGHAFHVPHDPSAYRAIGTSTRFTRGLEDALTRCYKAADTALGRIIEAAPEGTTVAVHAGIGLRPNTNGTGILPKVLDALGYRSPLPISARTRAREAALRAALAVVPRPVLRRAKALVGSRAAYDHMVQVWTESVDWSTTRAWAEGEPGWGYVRLNVRGREPRGVVDPDDYRALCDEIAAELTKLVNVATGEPAVESVVHRDDLIGPSDDSPLPDLVVRWARTHLIRAVRHPVAGVIKDEMKDFRATEHNDDGWLVLAGPRVRQGTDIGEARLEDVAPTLIHLMGGAVPDDVEGTVLFDMLAPDIPPLRTCAASVTDTPLALA